MYLKKIIEQIWEELDGFNITDDSLYDYEYLKDKVISANSSLVKDTWRNKLSLDTSYWTCPCIEVECYKDSCTINGITITSNYPIYRATLPQLIKEVGWDDIAYFGMNGFSGSIKRVTFEGFRNQSGNVWTKSSPAFMVIGSDAIIKNIPTKGFSMATIVALYEDVTQACNWSEDDMMDFPCPSLEKLSLIVKKNISFSGRPDLIHDSQIALNQQLKQEKEKRDEED